ncbi:MAG TPA: 2-oxoacid:acceptor oxidoreductase family protein, partial [Fervidobacterium sp.]|nr:2-oxoacid:acceptor oxidoreductase family protein [Fervidobacterium sp.]
DRTDINVIKVPCNEIADELGNLKVSNMVMLGAVVGGTDMISTDNLFKALEKKLGSKESMIEVNKHAIMKGYELAKASLVK